MRYYKNEKLAVEINAPKDFYRGEEATLQGRKFTHYHGHSVQMARHKNFLYHFFRLDSKRYCDIFDLKTHHLLHRIKLEKNYTYISHYKDKTFYALANQLDEEEDYDIVLCKFEL